MQLFGALEAGGTKMVCAIVTAAGDVLARTSIPTQTPAETMPRMIEFFRQSPIAALGVGCFGPVDLDRRSPSYGSITTTPKLAWRSYPIVQEFEKALSVPVGFDTDVNAAALGEATYGCTQDVQSSIYITVGTGVGVGVILGGKPHHGMLHPEGGHMLLARRADDPLARGVCPYHESCLEGLAAGPAIAARWGKPGAELAGRKEVWELEAYYIGQAICDYILILSPERIVLGGGVMHQDAMLPLVRAEVQRQLGGYIRCPRIDDWAHYIVGASLNDNQGILGAAKLAQDAYSMQEA